MAKRKPKFRRSAPLSPKCNKKTRSGKPCKCNALPGKDTCFFHSPEHAKAAKKGGKATAAKWATLKTIAKRWPIGQSWKNQINFLEANVGLAKEKGTRGGEIEACMWNKQLIKAMDCRSKYETIKEGVIVQFVVDGQKEVVFNVTDKPRPKPSEDKVDGGHDFRPPKEG